MHVVYELYLFKHLREGYDENRDVQESIVSLARRDGRRVTVATILKQIEAQLGIGRSCGLICIGESLSLP